MPPFAACHFICGGAIHGTTERGAYRVELLGFTSFAKWVRRWHSQVDLTRTSESPDGTVALDANRTRRRLEVRGFE
jgi:hypothetical protein